jgi:UDP-glucose 6-dehydrogenase
MALIRLLYENVIAYDPKVQVEQSVESAQTCVDYSDIVVITTPWPEFREIQFHEGQVVIDCWRMLDETEVTGAGAKYVAIGVGPCKES